MNRKNKMTLLIGGAISVLLLLISPESMATEQQILKKITILEDQIMGWQREVYFVGLLAILIAVAGGIVTLLQGSSHRYTKPVVAVLGVVVISLVTTQEQFFSNSKTEIHNKVSNATQKIDEVKAKIANQNNKDGNFYLAILQELNTVLYAENSSSVGFVEIISPVFAGDEDSIYFSGVGIDESVIYAEKVAIKNAEINAARDYIQYLVENINATTEELENIDFIDAIGNFMVKDKVNITNESGVPRVKVILRVNSNIDRETKDFISNYILQKRNSTVPVRQPQAPQIVVNSANDIVTTVIEGELNRGVSKAVEASASLR